VRERSSRLGRRTLGGTHAPKDKGHCHSLCICKVLLLLSFHPFGEGLVGGTGVGELECLVDGHSMVVYVQFGKRRGNLEEERGEVDGDMKTKTDL